MAMDKDTPVGNPAELSGWISNLVRSPAKSGNPASDKRTKQLNMKAIATNQEGHPKLCCPKCGRALTLSKNGLHRVRRYGKKINCPVCGLVSPVARSPSSTETPPRNIGWQKATKEAIALARQSRWKEAVAANQSITESFPTDVDAYNRLGRALIALGEFAGSRDAYRCALKVNPDNTIAKKNLSWLSPQREGKTTARGSSLTDLRSGARQRPTAKRKKTRSKKLRGHPSPFTPYKGLPPWPLPGSFGTGKRR